MAKKIKPPPGLDYSPVLGEMENFSFGVGQAMGKGDEAMTAEKFVFRRMYPVDKPDDHRAPWVRPTCYDHDVLLPYGASDHLRDPQRLCRAYDEAALSTIRDLVVIITLRFPETETIPQEKTLHEAWEVSRAFALRRLVQDRGVAVIPCFHVPSRASAPGFPHVHLLVPARILLPSGFGLFAQPLASDEGRALIEAEWLDWRKRSGRW